MFWKIAKFRGVFYLSLVTPISVNFSPFRPIPANSSLFQRIQAYSQIGNLAPATPGPVNRTYIKYKNALGLRNVVSLIALMVIKNFFQRQNWFIILYHAFIVVIFQCLYLFQPKNYEKKKNRKRPEEKSIINTSCPSSYNFLRVQNQKNRKKSYIVKTWRVSEGPPKYIFPLFPFSLNQHLGQLILEVGMWVCCTMFVVVVPSVLLWEGWKL